MTGKIYEIPNLPSTLPDGTPFDPVNNATHRAMVMKLIDGWKAKDPGERRDLELLDFNMDRHVVRLARRRDVAVIQAVEDGRWRITLSDQQCRPNKGREVATLYERRDEGVYLIEFKPYEGVAWLGRLTPDQVRCRDQVAAAVKLDPWRVHVKPAKDKGWIVSFDEDVVYDPRDDDAIRRAVTAIGSAGWWFDTDLKTNTITIHPGELPTFRPVHPYPVNLLGDPGQFTRTDFGVLLPKPGHTEYRPAGVDWKSGAFLLAAGEGGSGKSVFTNVLLAGLIAQRFQLSIVDTNSKATDYYWCRPWVTKNGWGCGSYVQAAGVLGRLVSEMESGERAQAWKENAWQSWYSIPDWAKEKYPIHVIVVDEYASLTDQAMDVKSLPNPDKVLPAVCERMFTGYAQSLIKRHVARILRLGRFMGYRLILLSQTVNDKVGLGPTIRDLFTHRVAMGPNPSESLEKGVFHDLKTMPTVPANIRDGGVAKGVGRGELNDETGRVFKVWWAGHDGMKDTEALGRLLTDRVGLPDGVDRARYLNTISPHGPDDPIDAEYVHELTERISLPYADALASDAILASLKQVWDDSRMNFEGPAAPSDGPDDGSPSTPSPTPSDPAPTPSGASAQLMDAADLARAMEGRA